MLLTPLPASAQGDTPLEYNEIQQLLKAPQPRIEIPGLKLTPVQDLQIEQSGTDYYLNIPYIGEYIAAIYRYGVVAITILAVITILIAGIQWMLPGNIALIGEGDQQQRINKARDAIMHALIALLIAVGSYTLLYTINPNLVEFKSLRVLLIKRQELGEPETQDESDITYVPDGVFTRPTWNALTFSCERDRGQEVGVTPKSSTITYTCPRGMNGYVTTIPEMKEPLCKVASLLNSRGYGLEVKDSYRPFARQADYWCGRGLTEYPDVNNRKKYYAVPGTSNHGHGVAVDAHLTDRDGKRLYNNINSKTQCNVNPEYIKILAQAFFEADPKFVRLTTEIWHFEYGTGEKKKSVGRNAAFETKPSACP